MPKPRLPEKGFVWTPELAYAVGLLVTDGYLSKSGRHLTLRSSEKEQLLNYKKCLGIEHIKIGISHSNGYSTKPSYYVTHGNIQLYNWLRRIGIPPNKTYDIEDLKIPNDVFPDFLRGHLDGDGSVTTYTDRYNVRKNPKYVYERLWIVFLSANKQHLEWIQSKTSKIMGVKGHLNKRVPKDPKRVPMYSLKFGKKESLKLIDAMYYHKDLPCLQRKRRAAESFVKKLKTR